jgi:IS5 family transposase
VIAKARRETRFVGRAVRIDSTVIEADVRYPTDAGLAAHGVRALAREGRKLAGRVGETRRRVRDRSRALGRRLRAVSRSIRRRSGQAKAEVLELTAQTGRLLERSVREARRLAAAAARSRARGRGARVKLRAAERAGARRSLRDGRRSGPQARRRRADPRPARVALRPPRAADPQGQLGKPTEFLAYNLDTLAIRTA